MSHRYIALFASLLLAAQSPARADWPHWAGDLAATNFAPHDQIHAGNVDSLKILWRYRLPDVQLIADSPSEWRHRIFKGRPIAKDGVLYTFTPFGFVVALDGATGKELWRFDTKARYDNSSMDFLNRGVAYWSDGQGKERILFGTWSDTLYSVDAQTGLPDPAFGDEGRIDLTEGMRASVNKGRYALCSPPTIVGDVAIVGSTVADWHYGSPPNDYMSPGDVRGYDVHTGELLWVFHTIPQPGEVGYDTWAGTSWDTFGAANVWATISADEDRGLVYLPVSSVSLQYYGGERHGLNLFSDALVCLNARTGEREWHYQMIHHTLWNYDPPAAPILLDVIIDGAPREIVVQLTKTAFAFVFDRITGEPIWPIEEKSVPQSTAPGEQSWPTQPHPTWPLPFDLQGLTADDLNDFTPALRAEALKIVAQYEVGPMFLPPSERGSINVPGEIGGADWVGGAADPRTGMLYVPSHTLLSASFLKPGTDARALAPFGGFSHYYISGPEGLPLTRPPYGRLTAIDMHSGKHQWMRAMGPGPVDHPTLQGLPGVPAEMGWPNRTFTIATPGLIWAASQDPGRLGEHNTGYYYDRDAYLYAYDAITGARLTRHALPDNVYGGLISYMARDRQYVVTASGGNNRPAELVALGVPRAGEAIGPQAWTGYQAEHPAFELAVAAIDAGDVTRLQALLQQHPGLARTRGYLGDLYPLPDQQGATLLHLLAGSVRARLPDNVAELARTLMAAGADANAKTSSGQSMLELVVVSEQLEWSDGRQLLIALLLSHGAQSTPTMYWQALVGRLGWEPWGPDHFDLARELYDAGLPLDLPFAAALGMLDEMQSYFVADGTLLPSANTQYRPNGGDERSEQQILNEALGYAAFAGQIEAARFLLQRGAQINAQPVGHYDDNKGQTPLHRAVDYNNHEMVDFLLTHGADPMIKDNEWEGTPLDWAWGPKRAESRALLEAAVAAPDE